MQNDGSGRIIPGNFIGYTVMNSALFAAITGSVIRTALVFLGGLLTAHGIMSADQYQAISPQLQEALGGIVSAGALGWAAWQKNHAAVTTAAKESAAATLGTTTAQRAGDPTPPSVVAKASAIVATENAQKAGV